MRPLARARRARATCARAAAASSGAGELERQHHVLERGQRRQQLERLEHEAEQALAHRGARVLVERSTAPGRRSCTSPDVGRSRPASKPSSVVLPEPDAPTIATDAPASTVERNAVEDGQRIVAALDDLGQRLGADDGFGHGQAVSGARGPALEDVRPRGRVSRARSRATPDTGRRRLRPRTLYASPSQPIRARSNRRTRDSMTASSIHLRRFLLACCCALRAAATARGTACAPADAPVLLVVGDSISAGYGLAAGQVWVDLLAAKLKAERLSATASSMRRSPATRRPAAARACRRCSSSTSRRSWSSSSAATTRCAAAAARATRDNLDAMVAAAQAAGAKVLVVGMQLPPNYGPAYVREFDALFARRREGAQGGARALSVRGLRRGPRAVPARPHPSDGGSAAEDARQRLAGACRRCSARRYGERCRRFALRQSRRASRRMPRLRGSHRRAQPVGIRRRSHPRRGQPAGAGRRGARATSARCTRRRRRSTRSKRRRGARRAQHRAHRRDALRATSRASGRRSSTAGAAASAAARSRTC